MVLLNTVRLVVFLSVSVSQFHLLLFRGSDAGGVTLKERCLWIRRVHRMGRNQRYCGTFGLNSHWTKMERIELVIENKM